MTEMYKTSAVGHHIGEKNWRKLKTHEGGDTLAESGETFHSGMNSGYKQTGKKRQKDTRKKNYRVKNQKHPLHPDNTWLCPFFSNLHPQTPLPRQFPARSATDSPEIMLFLCLDTPG